ncbi:MAG: hypothetical protein ACREO1_13560 [Arenimonas sp.]
MPENKLLRILLVCIASVALAACQKDKQAAVAGISKKVDPLALESELKILALNGRIESGKNNPEIDWVSPFENATGCKVKATLVENGEAIAASLDKDNFDLVISAEMEWPPDFIQSIDIVRLRSFKELDKRFLASTDVKQILVLPFQWQKIKPVAPETEFIPDVENIHLLAKAKNPNCAYAWMEWSLSPKVQADIAASLGTIPVVPAACIGNEALGDDACRERMSETVEIVSEEVPADAPAEESAEPKTP